MYMWRNKTWKVLSKLNEWIYIDGSSSLKNIIFNSFRLVLVFWRLYIDKSKVTVSDNKMVKLPYNLIIFPLIKPRVANQQKIKKIESLIQNLPCL